MSLIKIHCTTVSLTDHGQIVKTWHFLMLSLLWQMKILWRDVALWHDWNKNLISFTLRDHQQPIRARSRGRHQSLEHRLRLSCVLAPLKLKKRLWQGPIIQQLISCCLHITCQLVGQPRTQRLRLVISHNSNVTSLQPALGCVFLCLTRCYLLSVRSAGRWGTVGKV